jgi:SAM-dependent methyltransferase
VSLEDAERAMAHLHIRPGSPYGKTRFVLLRDDHAVAYPITAETPVLLAPEALAVSPVTYDLGDRRWAEAYREMEFYNNEAAERVAAIPQSLVEYLVGRAHTSAFPSAEWVDSPYDAAAQLDAYHHLGITTGQRVAQLGGKGVHAVNSLLAGASEAWLITPMRNEVLFGYELARRTGVSDRFQAVIAVAEELPFQDEVFDAIYSGGCLHHMVTDLAGPEIRRVLAPGGRFAAVEPWQTTMHRVGTRLIGKREANAYCRPLDEQRVAPMRDAFGGVRLEHHGPLLRYLALGLSKITRRQLSARAGIRMTRIDDALPLPARMGGSIALLATRD